MGLFDTVILPDPGNPINDRYGQVKCWDPSQRLYTQGDNVPRVGGKQTYNVHMNEGGYLNIVACQLISWTNHANFASIFDKYGDPVGEGQQGKFIGHVRPAEQPVVLTLESDYT